MEVYDKCRRESAWRNYVGEFCPSSTVGGINAQGSGSSISFSFSEGINGNSNIYTNVGGNTARVEFCAQVGLYYSGTLVNFAEVKMTYNVDLITNFASLTGFTVTAAEAYTDADDKSFNFDGTLYAYFCNASSYEELIDNGAVIHQGSTLNLCFKVPQGNFEIAGVKDLMIKNAIATEPNQNIISNSVIDTPTYAEKTCHDSSNDDTNVCVVSFLLKAAFYDYSRMTLTGEGTVILEFGGAGGPQRQLRYRLLEEKVGHVTVKAKEMMFAKQSGSAKPEKPKDEKATGSTFGIPLAVAAFATMVVLLATITGTLKHSARRKAVAHIYREHVLQRLTKRNCSATHLSNATVDMTMCMSLSGSDQTVTLSKKSLRSMRVGDDELGGDEARDDEARDDERHILHSDSCTSCLSGSDALDLTPSMLSALNMSDAPIVQRPEEMHGSLSSIDSGVSC